MDPKRILILGGPRTGKTTLANKLGAERGIPVRGMDDLIGAFDWSAASAEAARWMDDPGPWIIEGVQGARALRKWLAAHPEGQPADLIIHCQKPHVPLTAGQIAMGKGCLTVWGEVAAEVVRRGALVIGSELVG